MRRATGGRSPSTTPGVSGLDFAPGPRNRVYLSIAAGLLTVAFAILTVRLFDLQVLGHARARERVERMLRGVDGRHGIRGDIVLKDGLVVARDFTRFVVGLDPAGVEPEYHATIIDHVCRARDVPDVRRRDIHRDFQRRRADRRRRGKGPLRYLPLARELRREEVQDLLAGLRTSVGERFLSLGGDPAARERFEAEAVGDAICVEPMHFRRYPMGAFLAHGLGLAGLGERATDLKGISGLELSMNSYLEGWDGHKAVLCDGTRRTRLYRSDNVDIAPIDGYNVHLTVVGRLQRIVEEELAAGVTAKEADSGVAVVLDVSSGDILALASFPDLDPNRVGGYPAAELRRRLMNHAVESQFEPGSTIKPLIAAYALDTGRFHPDQPLWKGGAVAFFLNRRVEDVRDHGPLTLEGAVVHSSNIGMTVLGLRLGGRGINEAFDRFRIGEFTGVPLPGELDGSRRPREGWSERNDTISCSFGYALTVTPMQLACAYASLVNGGVYYRPRLVDHIERGGESRIVPVEELRRSISPATSATMRRILHAVVEEGTMSRFRVPGLPYGAKTGTAAISRGDKGYRDAEGNKEYLSSIAAFAPHVEGEVPEVVIVVMIQKPRRELGYYGSTVCGPVVEAMLRRMYRIPEGRESSEEKGPVPRLPELRDARDSGELRHEEPSPLATARQG